MSKPLQLNKFVEIINAKYPLPGLRLDIIKRSDVKQNQEFRDQIRQLFENGNFNGSRFHKSDAHFVLCYMDKRNKPVSAFVLRKYTFTPGTKRFFMHVEYALTKPKYEGKGLSTRLWKITLAFAYDLGCGGVSTYAISHGSQIPTARLGFKAITPMKYKLTLSDDLRNQIRAEINTFNLKLNKDREMYYMKSKMTTRRPKEIMRLTAIPEDVDFNVNTRLATLRSNFANHNNRQFVPESNEERNDQYLAEIVQKHFKKNAKNNEWLNNGMAIRGLGSNRHYPSTDSRTTDHKYRPLISHIFTFASQKKQLFVVTNGILKTINSSKVNNASSLQKGKHVSGIRKVTGSIQKGKHVSGIRKVASSIQKGKHATSTSKK